MRVAGLTAALLLAGATPADTLDPREPGAHSVVYTTETVIAADSADVWRLLVDLPGYQRWNPWVIQASGGAEPGADVRVKVILGAHTMDAQHTVLNGVPGRKFCWRDAGWNSWFVYGQRCRTITPHPDGTVVLKNELLLDGVLSGGADHVMGRAMKAGMEAENAALKQAVER